MVVTKKQAVGGVFVLLCTCTFLVLNIDEEGGISVMESMKPVHGDAKAAHELQAASQEFIPVVKSLAKARFMCRQAKKGVAKKYASRSKARRDRALAAALAFCKKVNSAVQNLEVNDVAAVAGKHAASVVKKSDESSADQEKALIKKDIGPLRLTGHGAHKMAKDESLARAIRREGEKNIVKMKVKVRAACQKAKDKVKLLPRGPRRNKGQVVVKQFCANMKKAVAHEEATTKEKVRLVASGPGFVTSTIAAADEHEQEHEMHTAEAACKNAIIKAGAVANPIERLVAQKMALKFCNHVKAIVEKESVANKKVQTLTSMVPVV